MEDAGGAAKARGKRGMVTPAAASRGKRARRKEIELEYEHERQPSMQRT